MNWCISGFERSCAANGNWEALSELGRTDAKLKQGVAAGQSIFTSGGALLSSSYSLSERESRQQASSSNPQIALQK